MASETTTEEILAKYEELFANRYTDADDEYMKTVKKSLPPPPCIPDSSFNSGYSRGYQGRDDRRDRYSQGRHADRYHPYQRNDRQGGRYGDRHGDRYGSRSHDRYDDRSRYERKKPATEYGSQGYFQYYY